MENSETRRCDWAERSALEREYHDREWGVPVHDDRALFKMMILEGQQAGLSWSTILRKRETLSAAYDDFDPAALAAYDAAKIDALLLDEGVIRNRSKVEAAVHNARAYFRLCEECGSLDEYLWSFVDHRPIVNAWTRIDDIPARSPVSDAIGADLKRRGFKFVGSTTVYALMQSIGMVNDHLTCCPFYRREQ